MTIRDKISIMLWIQRDKFVISRECQNDKSIDWFFQQCEKVSRIVDWFFCLILTWKKCYNFCENEIMLNFQQQKLSNNVFDRNKI